MADFPTSAEHLEESVLDALAHSRGLILYQGQTVVPFEPRLHGVPIDALWRWGVS